jgi:hypothetical protein
MSLRKGDVVLNDVVEAVQVFVHAQPCCGEWVWFEGVYLNVFSETGGGQTVNADVSANVEDAGRVTSEAAPKAHRVRLERLTIKDRSGNRIVAIGEHLKRRAVEQIDLMKASKDHK